MCYNVLILNDNKLTFVDQNIKTLQREYSNRLMRNLERLDGETPKLCHLDSRQKEASFSQSEIAFK